MAVPIIPKSECYNKPSKKSSSFGLEMNASTLKALSQTLYDYKIEAVLREYSTNITDSHNDSGKEGLAGYVHVPTKLHPVVEFHDFGLGMSEETIFTVYTVFGCSTKREDNSTNGSLGFGSKSFNTVSDQMTVTSIKDGTKTVVLCYKDRKGELTADVKSSTKTEEPNGTVISIPVDPSKVNVWQSTAARVLGAFRVPHETNGFGDYQGRYDQMQALCKEVRESGSKFYQRTNQVMNDLRGRTWVLMGDVMYTLPDFSTLLPSQGDYLESVQSMVNQGMYVTSFEIGEVDHAPSRESISYDQETFMKCKHRVRKDVLNELRKFQEELGDIKNVSYYRFFHKYYNTPVYETLLNTPLPFLRGKVLKYVCPRYNRNHYTKLLSLSNREKYGKVRGNILCSGGYNTIFVGNVDLLDQRRLLNIKNPVILYSENEKGIYKIKETVSKASEVLNVRDVLVVDSVKCAENLLNFFGQGEVVCGDKFSPEKTKRKTSKGGKKGGYGVKEDWQTIGTVHTLRDNGYSTQFEMVDLSEESVYYIKKDGIKVSGIVKGKYTKLTMSTRVAELLYKVGVKKVVVENKNNTGKIKRSGIECVDKLLTETIKPLKREIVKSSIWNNGFVLQRTDEPLRHKVVDIKKFDQKAIEPTGLTKVILSISKFGLEDTKMYQRELDAKNKLHEKASEALHKLYKRLPLWHSVRNLEEDKVNHYLKLEKITK